MKKIIIYELIKLPIAFGASFLLFTLVPLSLYVVLLPVDLIGWLLVRRKISAAAWIAISACLYIGSFIFVFIWVTSGHAGLEFLLDVN